jgi:hypothetical protein
MYNSAASDLESLVGHLGDNILNTMIQGPNAVEFTADNLRLSYTYELISLISGGSIQTPLTVEEVHYDAPVTVLEVPSTGLSSCSNFDDYAKVAVVSWGFNPHSRDPSLSSALVGVTTVATGVLSSSTISPSVSSYHLTVPLIKEQNWTTQVPTCAEYSTASGGIITDCAFCNVSAYTDVNVTFSCMHAADIFCPVSKSLVDDSTSNTYHAVQSVDKRIVLSTTYPIQSKQSFQIMAAIVVVLFFVLIGLVLLYRWDNRDQQQFVEAAKLNAEKSSERAENFDLSAAFDERGVSWTIEEDEVDAQFYVDYLGTPLTSLLSEGVSFYKRFKRAVKRHHKWIRIFTYPSIQKTRVTRLLVAATDLLFLLFAVTVFHGVFYPDDNECEALQTESECLALSSRYAATRQCSFDVDDGCSLASPSLNMQFLAFVSLWIIVLTLIPRRLLQLLLEKVCNKRPVLDESSVFSQALKEEPPVAEDVANSTHHIERRQIIRLQSQRQASDDFTFEKAGFDISSRVPYFFSYCDTISAKDEVSVVHRSVLNYFKVILAKVELPWRSKNMFSKDNDDDDERSWGGGRSDLGDSGERSMTLATMGAIMRWMYIDANGTLQPLPFLQKLRFRNPTEFLIAKVSHARRGAAWIVTKASSEESIRPGQTEYMNNIMVQHFIMEQISPICRFAINRDLFNQDNSSCGRIPLLSWLAAWLVILLTWAVMAFVCIFWTTNQGTGAFESWLSVFAICVLVDVILSDCCQIIVLNVIVTDKLRPQFRQIYDVLLHVLEQRLPKNDFSAQSIRVVQHMSAACRAARVPALSKLTASALLSALDDCDVALCRRSRMSSAKEIGFFGFCALYLPSCLNDAYTVVQQATLDLIFPIFWLCFFVFISTLFWISIYAALAFSIMVLLCLFVWFGTCCIDKPASDINDNSLHFEENCMHSFSTILKADADIRWDCLNNLHRDPFTHEGDNGASFYCAEGPAFDEVIASSSTTIFEVPFRKKNENISIAELKYNNTTNDQGVEPNFNGNMERYSEEAALEKMIAESLYRVDSGEVKVEVSELERSFSKLTSGEFPTYDQSRYLSSSDGSDYDSRNNSSSEGGEYLDEYHDHDHDHDEEMYRDEQNYDIIDNAHEYDGSENDIRPSGIVATSESGRELFRTPQSQVSSMTNTPHSGISTSSVSKIALLKKKLSSVDSSQLISPSSSSHSLVSHSKGSTPLRRLASLDAALEQRKQVTAARVSGRKLATRRESAGDEESNNDFDDDGSSASSWQGTDDDDSGHEKLDITPDRTQFSL